MSVDLRSSAFRLAIALAVGLPLSAAAQQSPVPRVTGAPAPGSLEALKQQADEAYRGGDFPRTIELADQVLARSARDHVALYLRASARVELGASTGDKKLIRDGIADSREAIRIEANGKADYYLPYFHGMAQLTASENQPSHAETAIDIATRLLGLSRLTNDERANTYYQRALLRLQIQKTDEAASDLKEAVRRQPKHLAAQLLLADVTAQREGPEAALEQFGQVVARFPENPLVLNNRAMFLQSQNRMDEALADFGRALALDPNYAPALLNRGYALLSQGKSKGAQEDFTRSLTATPGNPTALNLRAGARMNLGDLEGAVEDLTAVLQANPENPAVHADLGFARFFAKDYAAAKIEFDNALKLDPTIPFLAPWRCAALVLGGEAEAATKEFEAITAKPAESRDWFDVLTLHLLGQIPENEVLSSVTAADESMRQAQMCEAYYFIGLRKSHEGKADEAASFYDQSLQTGAIHLSAYRGARYGVGRFD